MIVQCRACLMRYHLDDGVLGSQGGYVRCTACQHVWFQGPGPAPRDALVVRVQGRPVGSGRWHRRVKRSLIIIGLGAAMVGAFWGGHYYTHNDLGIGSKGLISFSPSSELALSSFAFTQEAAGSLVCQGVLTNKGSRAWPAGTVRLQVQIQGPHDGQQLTTSASAKDIDEKMLHKDAPSGTGGATPSSEPFRPSLLENKTSAKLTTSKEIQDKSSLDQAEKVQAPFTEVSSQRGKTMTEKSNTKPADSVSLSHAKPLAEPNKKEEPKALSSMIEVQSLARGTVVTHTLPDVLSPGQSLPFCFSVPAPLHLMTTVVVAVVPAG